MSSQAVSSSLESAGTRVTLVGIKSIFWHCPACMCCAQGELETDNHWIGELPQIGACGVCTIKCWAPHRLAPPALFVTVLKKCTIFPYNSHALRQDEGLGTLSQIGRSSSAPGVNARPLTGL